MLDVAFAAATVGAWLVLWGARVAAASIVVGLALAVVVMGP